MANKALHRTVTALWGLWLLLFGGPAAEMGKHKHPNRTTGRHNEPTESLVAEHDVIKRAIALMEEANNCLEMGDDSVAGVWLMRPTDFKKGMNPLGWRS